jgi:hypothetical protein
VTERDELHALLGSLDAPEPPPALTARTLEAAAPLLALHAGRARWRAWLRPLAVSLLPLPAIIAADVALVRVLHGLLALVLPSPLSVYLVGQYALVLALLLSLAYAAVPLVAERQARARLEESHV